MSGRVDASATDATRSDSVSDVWVRGSSAHPWFQHRACAVAVALVPPHTGHEDRRGLTVKGVRKVREVTLGDESRGVGPARRCEARRFEKRRIVEQ
jgi:hypothetical protein